MDLDAYSAAHRAEWDRLAVLAGQRKLSGEDADELIELYQSASAHLAEIKATVGETVQGDHISLALAKARIRFTGTPANPLRQLTVFFANQLPAALYRIRWVSLAVTVAFFVIGTASGFWAANTPGVLDAVVGPEDYRQEYAEELFVQYYSESSEGGFASQVWTNNAWITAQTVMFGITGVFVPYIVFTNAFSTGVSGAILAEFDRLDVFFLYLAPHGQLELYSIFVAGAAGLLIFWSWVAPGNRTRRQALAEDGRAFFTIVIGLALSLLVSGIIEGVVTRQPWPWPIKIGIGTVALVAFLLYQWVIGRRAARAGETGDVEEFDAGAKAILAG